MGNRNIYRNLNVRFQLKIKRINIKYNIKYALNIFLFITILEIGITVFKVLTQQGLNLHDFRIFLMGTRR